jgi:AAA+ superfamily predicted ATPase
VTPANLDLLVVVLPELARRGNPAEAARCVREAGLSSFRLAPHRLAAARALFAAGDQAEALGFADGADGEALLLRARILSSLGKREEAVDAYQRAIALNPTLEDLDLRAAVGARVRDVEPADGSGRPRMRVISNDDTDESELRRLLHPEQKPITFANVGGLVEVKRQIERKIITPFKKPAIFEKFKKRIGGGILLYGPPGCGKTLLARATAGECKAKFFNVAIHDILDMYIGESERKLHAIFEKARSSPPAVLFFDELEALAAKRQHSREATSAKLVSQFLAEMDGFAQNNAGVLILGATNVPWAVDPAFRRPGRFDRVLFVPPPDREARESILSELLRERPAAAGIDCRFFAERTSGFSGADIENLVETATDEAIEQSLSSAKETPITKEHLLVALKALRPTTMEWLTTARNYARYANESGQYDEVLAFLELHGKKG